MGVEAMRLADGTEIQPGDKVTLDPTVLEQTGSRDAAPANGREGIVSGVDEENGLLTVTLDGADVNVHPNAIIDVGPIGRDR